MLAISLLPFLDTCLCGLWDIRSYASSSIFLSSCPFVEVTFLVHIKNGPEYLTMGISQGFIHLMRLLWYSLVSSSIFCYLVILLLVIFFHLLSFVCVRFQYFLELVRFCRTISSVIYGFLILCLAHFSLPNSIIVSRLYILTACIEVSNHFSFLVNSLISSMYIRWLIFLVIYEVILVPRAFPKYVIEWPQWYYK